MTKEEILNIIRSNINSFGCHIYLISEDPLPRFVYTIGLHEKVGFELVFAGGTYYSTEEVKAVINILVDYIGRAGSLESNEIEVPELGVFRLQRAEQSRVKQMVLGALDYYKLKSVDVVQVLPDESHWTIDIPDLSKQQGISEDLPWRWLSETWQYSAPPNSKAVTNIAALRGNRVTEAARWEPAEWELFAGSGPDTPKGEVRIVPLGTLLAIDGTLDAVAELEVGKALWRDPLEDEWQPWN